MTQVPAPQAWDESSGRQKPLVQPKEAAPLPTSPSPMERGIALLTELAERGEIDPWDVQVIEVIDRFLRELAPASRKGTGPSAYEADLSQSGQAFLYASMLVLLKADSLARAEVTEVELEEEDFFDPEGLPGSRLPLHLERQLRRRAIAQPPQQRRVTLQELINQLKLMSAAMEETAPRPRARRPRPQSHSQAVRTIAQLAHQENLTETAIALDQFLANRWLTLAPEGNWLDFNHLLDCWCGSPEHQTVQLDHETQVSLSPGNHSNGDRVALFWALLLLASQSKVELAQSEFYQDLKLRSLSVQAEQVL
ncbi:MAG: segregation/condensation protein A [Leptolyngbyaceae bacterium]|nr:segregation/condensation protein A [Leptolyngbyaceae bacterium]